MFAYFYGHENPVNQSKCLISI